MFVQLKCSDTLLVGLFDLCNFDSPIQFGYCSFDNSDCYYCRFCWCSSCFGSCIRSRRKGLCPKNLGESYEALGKLVQTFNHKLTKRRSKDRFFVWLLTSFLISVYLLALPNDYKKSNFSAAIATRQYGVCFSYKAVFLHQVLLVKVEPMNPERMTH